MAAFADSTKDSEDAFDARVNLQGTTSTASMYATDTLTLFDTVNVTRSGRYNRMRVDNDDLLDPSGGSGSLNGHYTYRRFNPAAGITWSPVLSLGRTKRNLSILTVAPCASTAKGTSPPSIVRSSSWTAGVPSNDFETPRNSSMTSWYLPRSGTTR